MGGGPGGPGGGGGSGGGGGLPGPGSGFFPIGAGGYLAGAARHAAVYGTEIVTGAIVDSISSAATMQKALIGVKNATGASNMQIDAIRQRAFDLGDQTGTTGVKAAEMLGVIARSTGGIFADKKTGGFDMNAFMAIAPTIFKVAKIQNLTRGVDMNHAVQTEIQLAHLFRSYSGASMNQTGDLLVRLSEMMPDSLDVARNQFTYFLPQFKALGVSDKDSVATMAFLDRFGYGRGKGGTNVSDLVQASLGGLQLTTHAQKGKDALLQQIGVIDSTGNSKFFTDKGADLLGFLTQLNKFATGHGRTATVKDFKSAFGIQGARIADLTLDPQFVKQLQYIKGIMNNKSISLFNQFGSFGNSADVQIPRAFNNIQSVLTEIGYQLLPGVTIGFRNLGDAARDVQHWLHEHRHAEREIMYGAIRMGNAVTPVMKKLGQEALYAAHDIEVISGWLNRLGGFIGWANTIGTGGIHIPPWIDKILLGGNNPPNLPPASDPLMKAVRAQEQKGVADHVPPRQERVTRGGRMVSASGHSSRATIRLEIGSNGKSTIDGLSQRDLKHLAREIAGIIGDDVEYDSRSGGSTPQMTGQSHYSITQGKVT